MMGNEPQLSAVFAHIQANAEAWGVYLSPPLPGEEMAAALRTCARAFGAMLPTEYAQLLAFSNGIETQRGILFNAASLHDMNSDHWGLREAHDASAGGSDRHPPKQNKAVDYLWLGSYGNMDMYIFHVASQRYRITSLGFKDVYGEFAQLTDFLLYLADPAAELA
jgi:hypothetical protein